jgi:midasin
MLHQLLNLIYFMQISLSFGDSFDEKDLFRLRTFSETSSASVMLELPDFVGVLERSKHHGLRSATLKHFHRSFTDLGSTNRRIYGRLGQWWISTSRLLLDLFVPNLPIDPSALQRSSVHYWTEQQALLKAHMELIRDFVVRTQGNTSNGTIQYLEELSKVASAATSTTPRQVVISRMDLGRLHMYWAEVHQFMNQVLSETKLAFLINGGIGDAAVPVRESVIQASITSFCQRLKSVYMDFADINSPLQVALHAMKLGLRLIIASAMNEETASSMPTLKRILTSPAISSAELLQSSIANDNNPATFTTILARLTAISCQLALGGDLQRQISDIDELYEQAYGLWSIDRARQEEKERQAQSLYRKQHGADDPTEVEAEEQDFLSIFPEFGDLLDSDNSRAQTSSPKLSELVPTASMLSLTQVHQELFISSQAGLVSAISRFEQERREITHASLQAEYKELPETLDTLSLPFQLRYLSDELDSLRRIHSSQSRQYDFYFDENIPEIRKAINVIEPLTKRVDLLLCQWSDQMVLQHLKSRCEAVMKLSFRSPVAKVLSALEQLLMNIEDWEMYANRENSLRTEQQALISLIVSWRRLELSAWQGLLDRHATDFASATSEWWFRLYDATIRGAKDIFDGDQLTSFLETLVPLLDEFMQSSNIGQFAPRLALLQSMEVYADHLAEHGVELQAKNLHRVYCILHSTRQYYSQFNDKVYESLKTQRSALETEIRGFIKLASWKDINVHALKQSAQKTHRQLYKIIRKFRDVLRQPAAPLLSWTPSKGPSVQLHPSLPPAPSPIITLPASSSLINGTAHLLNLPQTYENFTAIIQRRIFECLSNHDHISVESLAQDILSTSESLAKEPIPINTDATRKVKLQKNLLTRKRKAWSDFMKEFKRAGISANVKAEVLQQHASKSWVREQPVFVMYRRSSPSISKADEYLCRLFSEMPALRTALSDHHPDLPTRELQRAVSHAESVLSLAIRSRTR